MSYLLNVTTRSTYAKYVSIPLWNERPNKTIIVEKNLGVEKNTEKTRQ